MGFHSTASIVSFEVMVAHSSLMLTSMLADHLLIIKENHLSSEEKINAIHRAWISNTEVKLLERKTKLDSQGWRP